MLDQNINKTNMVDNSLVKIMVIKVACCRNYIQALDNISFLKKMSFHILFSMEYALINKMFPCFFEKIQ